MNALPQARTERNGYSTQKPKKLIKRFILASSNKNNVVADYYLGNGTTAKVCIRLVRDFKAANPSHAMKLIKGSSSNLAHNPH